MDDGGDRAVVPAEMFADSQVQQDVGKSLAPPFGPVGAAPEQGRPFLAGVGILVAWSLIGQFEGQDLAQVVDQFVAELRIGLPADGVVELTLRPACGLAGQALKYPAEQAAQRGQVTGDVDRPVPLRVVAEVGAHPPDGVRFPGSDVARDGDQRVAARDADLAAQRVEDLCLARHLSRRALGALHRDGGVGREEDGVVSGAQRADIAEYRLVHLCCPPASEPSEGVLRHRRSLPRVSRDRRSIFSRAARRRPGGGRPPRAAGL